MSDIFPDTTPRPPVLACALIDGQHIVDLWRHPDTGGWCVGNDDRSLVVDVPYSYSANDALDAYLLELPGARASVEQEVRAPWVCGICNREYEEGTDCGFCRDLSEETVLACKPAGTVPWEDGFFTFAGSPWFTLVKALAVRMTGPPPGRERRTPDFLLDLMAERGKFVSCRPVAVAGPEKAVQIGQQRASQELVELVEEYWPGVDWRTHVALPTAPLLAFESAAPGAKLVAVLAPFLPDAFTS